MKRLLFVLSTLIFLTSCQKEISLESGSGGSGGGGATSDSYQPVTAGSYWKYRDSVSGEQGTYTATGQQKAIGNRTYHIVKYETNGQPATEAYFYSSKPWYAWRQEASIGGAPQVIEFLHLNDTASVGFTWTEDIEPIGGLSARTNGEIIARNISKTVAGKNFTGVIHSRIMMEYEFPILGWQEIIVYDYFVAKGVGVIRVESELVSGAMRTAADLIEYSIK